MCSVFFGLTEALSILYCVMSRSAASTSSSLNFLSYFFYFFFLFLFLFFLFSDNSNSWHVHFQVSVLRFRRHLAKGKKSRRVIMTSRTGPKRIQLPSPSGLPVCVSRKLMILFSFFLSFAFVINSSSSFCCFWCCCVLVGVLSFPTNYGWLCNL